MEGHGLVRPGLRNGVAERAEIADLIARERDDPEARLAVQARGQTDEALDVRGHGLVRVAPLDDPVERDARLLAELDLLHILHDADEEVPALVGERLELSLSETVHAADHAGFLRAGLEQVLVEVLRGRLLDALEGRQESDRP